MFIKENKGQSTLEFAILIVVIIGALIAMQTFIKRGYQGRLRSASDDMGEQYSPGYTKSAHQTDSYTVSRDWVQLSGGEFERSGSQIDTQQQNRKGWEIVAKQKHEFWGQDPDSDEEPEPATTDYGGFVSDEDTIPEASSPTSNVTIDSHNRWIQAVSN
ncbi:MAG: hypothetical protein PHR44_08125 [Candidatus Omnitrophica bacterium]|nr:hypothetical protein [Candidatus Omnitrophota bacterium]